MRREVQTAALLLLLILAFQGRAETIAHWNFNSAVPDADPATGSFIAAMGYGGARVVNANYTFRGSPTGFEASIPDNSCVRMNGFPAASQSNKTAGIEFRSSTAGYEGVRLRYDHNNNESGSRYYRAQYSTNGVHWTDHRVITNAAAGWFVYTVDFSDVRAADNNPDFWVRLVSEFQSTATGSGAAAYVASQSPASYSGSAGTFWVDRVTFSGQRYRFRPEQLQIASEGSTVAVSWEARQGDLERGSSPGGPWQTVTTSPLHTNNGRTVHLPASETSQFFRLRQGTFRAMSYNIHHGAGTDGVLDLSRIAAVIKAQSPDLVGLQEVDRFTLRSGLVNQAAELGRLTGMYSYFGKNINYDVGEYGLAVLSKYPFKSTKHVLYQQENTSLERRGVNVVQVEIDGAEIVLFNTHLDHTASDAERLYQISQLKAVAAPYTAESVLLCGDFNFRPEGDCYASMRSDFADAWPRASAAPGYTFPSTGANRRIDYFWTRMVEIKPIQGWIPFSLASDHLPLAMEFLLPARR
jgi:endonuclease/exonuclease/phosphatase family metal-dependent hydrolase